MAVRASRNRSRVVSRTVSRLDSSTLETEPVRLQREADLFTSKLEHERRQKVILDEQLRQLTEELKTRTNEAKEKAPTSAKLSKLRNKILRLEHQLDLALSSTCKTQSENDKLRKVIDNHRQDKYNRKHMINSISNEIYEYSAKAEKHYGEYITGQRKNESQKSRISQLRSLSYNEHVKKNVRIEELNSLIKEDRQSKGNFIRNLEHSFNAQFKKNTESNDPTLVLKKLQNKWGVTVREKKRQLDAYSRNVKNLEEAAAHIKEATGVTNIEEITTTFIKSEEQQYSIGTYLNNLHADVEIMEESLRNLELAIKSNSKNSLSTEQQVAKMLAVQRMKCRRIKESLEKDLTEEADRRKELGSVFRPLTNILNLFAKSAFELTLSISQPNSEGEQFGDEKLLSNLGEIEELLSSLQIYLAMKSGIRSPTLKQLDLSSLPERHVQGKLVTHSEMRNLLDMVNSSDIEESRSPLKLIELRERARTRLHSNSIFSHQKSGTHRESRSFTPQPFSKIQL